MSSTWNIWLSPPHMSGAEQQLVKTGDGLVTLRSDEAHST